MNKSIIFLFKYFFAIIIVQLITFIFKTVSFLLHLFLILFIKENAFSFTTNG